MASRKRVLIVANKWWECDPVLFSLLNNNARPSKALGWPDPLRHPRPRPSQPVATTGEPLPRAVFHLSQTDVEVWCISDILEDLPDSTKYQSSSARKMERLPAIFSSGQVSANLIIAFGTAGYPSLYSENGNVVVGSRVFLHDCHPGGSNPDSALNTLPGGYSFETIIESKISPALFDAAAVVETSPKPSVLDRFVAPPLNPATPRLLAHRDYVALGSVNVTDYTEYAIKDNETVTAFTASANVSLARSLETTHGLIRVAAGETPFLFVSAITDRVGHFDEEVGVRPHGQNTAAALNGGVVLAWMLPQIDTAW